LGILVEGGGSHCNLQVIAGQRHPLKEVHIRQVTLYAGDEHIGECIGYIFFGQQDIPPDKRDAC
jgi:hypothetical protein